MEEDLLNLRCSACSQGEDAEAKEKEFETTDSLWCHIATSHTIWLPYECVHCPMICMPTERVLKQHYDLVHPAKMPKAIYTYDERKKSKIRRVFAESLNLHHNVDHNAIPAPASKNPWSPKKSAKLEMPSPQSVEFQSPNKDADITPQMGLTPTDSVNVRSCSFSTEITAVSLTSSSDETQNQDKTVVLPQYVSTIDTTYTDGNDSDGIQDRYDGNETLSPTPSLTEQTKSQKKTNATKRPKRGRIWCKLCQRTINAHTTRHTWLFHMTERRLTCNLCPYKTVTFPMMKSHARRHIGRGFIKKSEICWTDRTDELLEKYTEVFESAFGKYNKSKVKVPPPQIKCKLCGMKPNTSNRGNHIWAHHVQRKRFACALCDVGTPFFNEIKRHVTGRHLDAEEIHWTDNTKVLAPEFEERFAAAFGNYNGELGQMLLNALESADGGSESDVTFQGDESRVEDAVQD